MRRVILTRAVGEFVRNECSDVEQDEFFQVLRRIRRAPISASKMITVEWHQYTLRVFRFGGCIAIFSPFLEDQPIMVLECRRLHPIASDEFEAE